MEDPKDRGLRMMHPAAPKGEVTLVTTLVITGWDTGNKWEWQLTGRGHWEQAGRLVTGGVTMNR